MSVNFRDLKVYQKAFDWAMEIFQVTKHFPKSEQFALTDQLRRSSRSVCRAIGEGYRKRQYPKHFTQKISDGDMENSETQVSLDFAYASKYLNENTYNDLCKKSEVIGRMLNHMIQNPQKYQPKNQP